MAYASHPVQRANQGKKSGKWNLPLFVTLMVLLSSASCSQIQAIALSTKEEPKSGAVLFSDDFSVPGSGWGTWSRDGSSIAYQDGGLRFLINENQFDFWSIAGKSYKDVQIDVDAIKLNGPDDNDFGIICRYQNKDNFYMLVASSDGYYGVAKMKDGQYHMIGANQLQYSELINKGLAVNRLQVDCTGPTLRLSANGHMLIETSDTDFTSGDVGLIAGAYNNTGVELLFDNFVVKKP